MSLLTLEVELDQGRVIPKGGEALSATNGVRRNPLERDRTLSRIVFHEDPTTALSEDEWPEESR